MLNRISRHAPEWLRDFEEYIEIWKFYEVVDDADDQIYYNFQQFFVESANDEGLRRWETAFNLPHTGTLDERTKAILLLLRAKVPYSMKWLKNYLKIAWDDPNPFVVVHNNGDYIITFQPKKEIDIEAFINAIRKKIPANLEIEVLPAPIVIDENYIGQGMLESTGVKLLSSGVYDERIINPIFLGQGVYEADGVKLYQ